MSPLTDRLPSYVEVGGSRWSIDPDFRLMVELENAVTSPGGLSPETLAELLVRFYPQGLPSDPETTVDRMLWFYRCGKGDEEGGDGSSGKTRIYDFEQDAEVLYTSFLQAFKIDLTTDAVHWWNFRQLMFGLPSETPFAQRLHYRTADTSSMGKEQKKHYAKMKRLFAVKDRASIHETLAQRNARMLAYVERRFAEVERGKD